MPPKAAYAYNPRGFVADLRNTAPQASGGATIAEFGGTVGTSAAMAYDGVGNRTGMTNTQTGPTSYAYAYNSANELTQEQRVNPTSGTSTATYGYDGAQNRTSLNGSAIGHNQDNQFSDTTHYGYDGNGNPTGYTSPGNPVSGSANVTTFDPENRMTGYGISGSSALLNASYDSDGLRASKTGSSGTTYYVYDQQDRPVVELNASGVTTFVNTFGDNGLLSRRDVANSLTTYYAFDPQGSAVDVMQGNTGLPSAYSAFGIPASGGAGSSPFGFGAQWGYSTDAETGLVLCTHRYYDPYTGRFVNRDPASYDGGINLYNHVGNNPINENDPSGYDKGSGGYWIWRWIVKPALPGVARCGGFVLLFMWYGQGTAGGPGDELPDPPKVEPPAAPPAPGPTPPALDPKEWLCSEKQVTGWIRTKFGTDASGAHAYLDSLKRQAGCPSVCVNKVTGEVRCRVNGDPGNESLGNMNDFTPKVNYRNPGRGRGATGGHGDNH